RLFDTLGRGADDLATEIKSQLTDLEEIDYFPEDAALLEAVLEGCHTENTETTRLELAATSLELTRRGLQNHNPKIVAFSSSIDFARELSERLHDGFRN